MLRSSALFRCFMSNSETHTELWTEPFTQYTEAVCFYSVNHNRVQMLRLDVQPPDDCLNFWDEAWFLSLSVFELLSSSLLFISTSFRKAVVQGQIVKPGMTDHIWKDKGNHLPLWDKVEIIDRAEHWRIRRLKESAHMLGYNNLLSWPSIEMNTI